MNGRRMEVFMHRLRWGQQQKQHKKRRRKEEKNKNK